MTCSSTFIRLAMFKMYKIFSFCAYYKKTIFLLSCLVNKILLIFLFTCNRAYPSLANGYLVGL